MQLTNLDWDFIQNCSELLEAFKYSTDKFSGQSYPTNIYFIQALYYMFEKFLQFRKIRELSFFVNEMEIKFKKYWETIPLIHCIATLLDPSQGKLHLDTFFEYYTKFLGEENNVAVAAQQSTVTLDLFRELYSFYDRKNTTTTTVDRDDSEGEHNSKKGGGFFNALRAATRKKLKGKKGESSTSGGLHAIDLYLNQYFNIVEDNFDVLNWWKENGRQYPVLALMARDVLAVQVSSVASESAFSTSGRIIGDHRTNLSPSSLCMLTCLKDWFEAETKNKERGIEDEFIDNNSEEEDEMSKQILINYEE